MPSKPLLKPIRAEIMTEDPCFFDKQDKPTFLQQAGLNYEKAVCNKLKKIYNNVLVKPWIRYWAANKHGFCQPDALIFIENVIVLVEIKLSRMAHARTKLRNFYRPIVEALYPGKRIVCAQIYKNFTKSAHIAPFSAYSFHSIPKRRRYIECHFIP